MNETIQKVCKNLEGNGITPYYTDTKAGALELVSSFLKGGETVASGGSVTLEQCGIMEYLRSGKFHYLDREVNGLTAEDKRKLYANCFLADSYLCSSNAITENGELYNVDGNSNRVSALVYGPKSVLIVAGVNKIVPDLSAAVDRVRRIAAPKNSIRVKAQTYCHEKGECIVCKGGRQEMGAGCTSPNRICCNFVVSGKQRVPGRIKVILVGEPLGF